MKLGLIPLLKMVPGLGGGPHRPCRKDRVRVGDEGRMVEEERGIGEEKAKQRAVVGLKDVGHEWGWVSPLLRNSIASLSD